MLSLLVAENKRVGTALVYFEVNRSPSKGECDITPYEEGIEMKTEFRVHCRGWKDEVSEKRELFAVIVYPLVHFTSPINWVTLWYSMR